MINPEETAQPVVACLDEALAHPLLPKKYHDQGSFQNDRYLTYLNNVYINPC
jgi:hypothetical protein